MGSMSKFPVKIISKAPLFEVETSESVLHLLDLIESNFHQGHKSIAFSSTHYKNSQEKFITLSADFFHKKFPTLKVLIITFDIKHGVLSEFVKKSKIRSNYLYEFSMNLSILDWNSIVKEVSSPRDHIDAYDMIFWDLPDLKMIAESEEKLRSSFENMDALYVVSLKNSKFDDEHFKRDIFRFYLDHGLDIRTILPWQFGTKKRKPRNKFIKLFYDLFRR